MTAKARAASTLLSAAHGDRDCACDPGLLTSRQLIRTYQAAARMAEIDKAGVIFHMRQRRG
jgi:hypothetical protein